MPGLRAPLCTTERVDGGMALVHMVQPPLAHDMNGFQSPRLDDERWIAITTVAREFGVSRWAVQRWIQSKRLTAHKTPSGRWRVLRSEVNRLLDPP